MAQVFGISGAWAAVDNLLRSRHLEARQPHDLAPLLRETRWRHQQGLGPLAQVFDQELEAVWVQLERVRRKFPQDAALRAQPFNEAIRESDRKLSAYRSQPWLKQCTILLFPILRLLRDRKRFMEWKEQAVQSLRTELSVMQQDYDYRSQHRTDIVARRFQQLSENVCFLEQLLPSPELAGANAELEVIEELKNLPASYVVYSDLNLKAQRPIRFQGEFLKTAQLDHVVIGPGGIFVLEVKRWSRAFVERGDYFDPYEQVARASYLCYDLLRGHIPSVRVRSVLVNCGVAPPHRDDLHVKVVPLPELRGYINWFRKTALNSTQIEQVRELLTSSHNQKKTLAYERPPRDRRPRRSSRRRY